MGFDNVTAFSGLFYIISTKEESGDHLETILSWNSFWGNALQQPSFMPFSYNSNNVFEYLEMFDINDPTFHINCKNNNMDLKLWEKKENAFKELLNIPIKLHPFHETFSNPKIATQFYNEKMPVVSSTDWIDVNIGTAVQPILSARIQVTLAIGTPDQLNALKTSRNITVPPSTTSKNDNSIPKKGNPTALADMLSTFIDNLALSLPKRTETDQRQQYSTESKFQLRRTSDLLDALQSALKNPAPVRLITSSSALPFTLSGRVPNLPSNEKMKENYRVTINIDSARNLKCKEHTQNNDPLNGIVENNKPCTYVSFEAIECDKGGQHSNFVTKTSDNTCNPHWNEKFNVVLPTDLFQRINKRFILKVWRKLSKQQKSQGSNVDQDELIGVTALDLSFLSSESHVSGYFNILNSAGRTNGQIKISIVPTDDNNCQETSENSADETELPNNLKDLDNGSCDLDNIILSRTLKRKFTELEEINQRLKSRLLDVTEDDNIDIDEEFENDLNTCPDEDDVDSEDQFDWTRFSTLEIDCTEPDIETRNCRVNGETGDHFDFFANTSKHSVLNISSDDSKNLPADENASNNLKTSE